MKEPMVLFGDEIEVRDHYVAVIAQGLAVAVANVQDRISRYHDVQFLATNAFDLAEALIEIRRQRTVYTCAFCGKVALKPGSERCPECAEKVCVRCQKPFSELHHICIREFAEIAR